MKRNAYVDIFSVMVLWGYVDGLVFRCLRSIGVMKVLATNYIEGSGRKGRKSDFWRK